MALIDSGQVQQAPDLRPDGVRARPNQTIEAAVEGLSNIGEQAVATVDKKNIADIERTVTEDREQIGRMFNENDVRNYLGGVDNATSDDIIKSGKRLQAMQKATRTGAMSQMAYDVQVDIATRRLKSKYPGYEDEIDEMIVSKFYGGTPANRVRNELLAATSEGASTEQKLQEQRLKRYIDMGGSMSVASQAAQGNPEAWNTVEQHVTAIDAEQTALAQAKSAAEAGKENAYQVAQKLAKAYNGIYSKLLFETDNGRKLQEARALIKSGAFSKFTREDMKKMDREVEPQLIQARDSVRAQLSNDPAFQKLANQLTGAEQEQILAESTKMIDVFLGSDDEVAKDLAVEWHNRRMAAGVAEFQGDNEEFFKTGIAIKDALGEQASSILYARSGSASGRAIDQIIRDAFQINDRKGAEVAATFFDPNEAFNLQDILAQVSRHTQKMIESGDTSGKAEVADTLTAMDRMSTSIVEDNSTTNTQQNNKILSLWDTSNLDRSSFPVQPQSSLQSTETYLKSLVKDGTFPTIAKDASPRTKAAVESTIVKVVDASKVRLNSVLSNSRVTYNPVSGRVSFKEEISPSPMRAIEGIGREFSRLSLSEKDIRSTEFIANAYVQSQVALKGITPQEAATQFGQLINSPESIEQTEGNIFATPVTVEEDEAEAAVGSEETPVENAKDKNTSPSDEPVFKPLSSDLNIEYRGLEDFVYGKTATENAEPFIGAVLHHTKAGSSLDSMVKYGKTVDKERGGAFGYHFYIGPDGKIVQGAPLNKRTNHISPDENIRKDGTPLKNQNAIGISLVGAENGETPEQIEAAKKLLEDLKSQFGIKTILGHGEMQTNRMASEGAWYNRSS